MSHTITIRLTPELAEWLETTSRESGISQGKIIREQLERARAEEQSGKFMQLAGTVSGPRGLSTRRGFSKK